MRRRWQWPILDKVRSFDGDDWVGVWLGWLVAGFGCVVTPVMALTTDKHDNIQMTPLLMWVLIGWGVPLVAPVLFFVAGGLLDFAKLFVPKRITEPVREDLRHHHHH